MKVRSLKVRARNTLDEYLDKWQEDYEGINVEAPIYYAELEMCGTAHELLKYMTEFSDEWDEMYQVFKWITVIKKREKDNLRMIEYKIIKLINKCETFIEALEICKALNYSKSQIKKDYIKYTKIKPWEYNNEVN